MLFVEPPSEEMLRRFPNLRAIGVAGYSRTMSPAEMDARLPDIFRALQQQQPRFVHYKVCSTFDSSPKIGSIGRTIEIGQSVFKNRFVPLVVGAPSLQRFCVFGNLFARSGLGSPVYRLDRHPTMRHHPVTPMTESDLCHHLARQTAQPIGLVDVLALDNGLDAVLERLSQVIDAGAKVVLFDTLTDQHLTTIGRLLAAVQEDERTPLFIAGSSGIEYALTKHWQSIESGRKPDIEPRRTIAVAEPVDRMLVISGSCSPVTGRQIEWALEHGFDDVRLDTETLCCPEPSNAATGNLSDRIVSALRSGRSAIVHSCCGPEDPRLTAMQAIANSAESASQKIGRELSQVLSEVVHSRSVRRVAVFGGDTSGHVARSLGIDALEFIGPLEPGAPLSRVHSHDEAVDGLEIVFKGGQVGSDDFLATVRHGTSGRRGGQAPFAPQTPQKGTVPTVLHGKSDHKS